MNRPRAWGPAPGRRLASAGQGLWRGFRRSWTQGLQLTLALALVLAGLLPLPLLQPQPAQGVPHPDIPLGPEQPMQPVSDILRNREVGKERVIL